MNPPLLIELGTEDLPARYVLPLAEALVQGIGDGLAKRNVAHGATEKFATPRRIAVRINDVADRQPDQVVERRGPALAAAYRDGQPTSAALGFARKCGVDVARLKKENGQLVYRAKQKGRATRELIPEIFEEALKQMDELVPKRMRWSAGDETFVRPVQWLLALFGGRVVRIERFGLKSGNKTYGHRFHAPKAIILKSPAEYEEKLRAAKVWADFAGRRDEIWRQVEVEAKKLNGRPDRNDALLDEVTALVEWPVAVSGRIEERFLALPPEVIIATVEHNQRYFPVFNAAGKLLPAFITVTNIESRDVSQIIAGNERVVRPRLADALFFWQQDRKRKLADYVPGLDRVTFQKELGSVGDKVSRVTRLAARHIAPSVNVDSRVIERAAALCKADLLTRMVFEFPELQGIMGGYYAESSGEPREVARAIREHYLPAQAGGPIPVTRAGQVVALADKLDTMAGIFAVGRQPTGDKDPFGLRRAASGVLRILIEGGHSINLRPNLFAAVNQQPNRGKETDSDQRLADEIVDFVLERLRSYLAERGIGSEIFEAVRAVRRLDNCPVDDPHDFFARAQAVFAFQKRPQVKSLTVSYKRIRNILRQATETVTDGFSPQHFEFDAERDLGSLTLRLQNEQHERIERHKYDEALSRLADLKDPLERFFTDVMVMSEDPVARKNRLGLLKRLDFLCRQVADIACLPG